jgi:lysophospholipase L1-like esterase
MKLFRIGAAAMLLFAAGCAHTEAPAKGTAATKSPTMSPTTKPARYVKEIEAFEAADRKDPPKPGGVVLLGSSSIRIWNVKTYFPGLPVVNRGFGGSHISDSVMYFDRIIPQHKPKLIVFYAGDNDIAAGKKPERVAADFKTFLAEVHSALPGTKVLLIDIKPSIRRWDMIDKMRDANRRMNAIAEADPLVKWISFESDMVGPDGKPRPELFREDGLHMSPMGYDLWTKRVKPIIEEAVSK